ncbi:MAG: hypothetical protein V5A45_04640 [Haloarculaceae archaeon]
MQSQFVSTVFVVLLVMLAGCVGGNGTSETGTGPDGSPDGDVTIVENRTAALLDAGGYTSVWEMNVTSEADGVSATTYTHAVDYENERSSFGMLLTSRNEVSTAYENFYADGTSYTRYGEGEEATYQVADGMFAPENTLFSVESFVTSGSDLAAFSAAGTETYDGVTVTRYERTDQPAWIAAQGTDGEFSWTAFNYVVLVDADGLIRYESWGGEGVDEAGAETTMTFSYSLTDVGSTVVEEPGWLTTAIEQANR